VGPSRIWPEIDPRRWTNPVRVRNEEHPLTIRASFAGEFQVQQLVEDRSESVTVSCSNKEVRQAEGQYLAFEKGHGRSSKTAEISVRRNVVDTVHGISQEEKESLGIGPLVHKEMRQSEGHISRMPFCSKPCHARAKLASKRLQSGYRARVMEDSSPAG
jgi:hypothetical protein